MENWVLPANQMEFSRKLGLLDEKRRRSGNFGSKLNFKWSLYLKDRKETDPGETSNNRILVV